MHDTVEVQGHRIHYLRAGAGEPLLLVHGITTSSFIWRNLIPPLAEHFDVLAVDLLGCGESDKPLDQSYGLGAHADRLGRFVEALGLGPVHYVGHDLGGGMGQVLAVRRPDLLRDLALVNTVAYDYWPVQPITALRTPIVREFLMAAMDMGAFQLLVRRGLVHKERATPRLMDLFMAPLREPAGRKAFLHFARCLDSRDLTAIAADLRTLSLPVLVVRGDADPYLSANIAERLIREIPGSRLVHIPTGSHFIQEDEPEQLTSALLEFLGVPA